MAQALPEARGVAFYPPVPLAVARVADVERVQMLVESVSRQALQRLLAAWLPPLRTLAGAQRGESRILRWAIDVDPLEI